MVGEHVPPDDELARDDEEPFILDDWDEELDIVAKVDAELDQQLEVLHEQEAAGFKAAAGPGDEFASEASPFVHGGASEWAGASLSPAEMGLSVPGEDADIQEIELGHEEGEPDAAADERFFGGARPRQPQSLSQIQPGVSACDSGSFDSGDDWTPVQDDPDAAFQLGEAAAEPYSSGLRELGAPEEQHDDAEDPAEFGMEQAGALQHEQDDAVEGDYAYDEQSEGEYADEYAEGEYAEGEYADDAYEYEDEYEDEYEKSMPAAGPVVVAPTRSRLPRVAATLAAVMLIGLVAATVVLKPEWLGVASVPLVDRTEIARPTVALPVEAPVAEFPPDPPPAPAPPVVVAPDPADPIDPPVGNDPEVEPTLPQDPPVVEVEPAPQPVVSTLPADPFTEPLPPAIPADGLVAIGDDLRIGSRVDEGTAAPGARHAMAANLIAGSQALVKLRNGNYFIGTVNKFDASALTLRVQNGQLHLLFDDMLNLVSLSEAEFKALQAGKNGFVRLRNRNRLFGSIEDLGLSDSIVLSSGGNRVVIPREAIEEIGQNRKDGVQVTDDLDDAWMRQLVEQRLQQYRQLRSEPDARDR
jgi:hypothetical protein